MSDVQTLYQGQYLNLLKRGHWEYASRPGPIDAVAIIAVTQARELILVEQHRIPVNARTIELPAGLARDSAEHTDEPLLAAAQRELEEETGHVSDDWSFAFNALSSGGLTDEAVNCFRAQNCKQISAGGGIENEDITVHKVPLTDVRDWLTTQTTQGQRVDARVYAALAFV